VTARKAARVLQWAPRHNVITDADLAYLEYKGSKN
jgi:hypothetical protein